MLKLLQHLPRGLRTAILRRSVRLDERELAGLHAEIASSPEDALAACRLVHDAYVRREITKPHPTRVRVARTQLLPTTFTIVAKDGDRVIGTISLQTDSELGLEMDGQFGEQLAALRAQGRMPAEVGALAVDPAYRRTGVFHLLNRTMLAVAEAVGVDDLVITVSSFAAELYRAVLCFDVLGEVAVYGKIDAAIPSTALRLPLDEARARSHKDAPRSHWLYFEREWTEVRLPAGLSPASRAQIDDGRRAAVRALLRARPDVFRALSTGEVRVLRKNLPKLSLPTPLELDPRQLRRWVAS